MKSHLIIPLAFLLCAFLIFPLLAGCAESEDDSDSENAGAQESNGWTADGCDWKRSSVTGAYTSETQTDDIQSCIPALPDDDGIDHETLLTEIFEGLMGEYDTESGGTVTMQCRPEGGWTLPNSNGGAYCDTYFSIPIAIIADGGKTAWDGRIEHDLSGVYHPEPMWFYSARLFFSDAQDNWEFTKEQNGQPGIDTPDDDDSEKEDSLNLIIWNSTFPDQSRIWTKEGI